MIFAVLLVAGVSAAVWLGACARRSWREQRAVLAYELTPHYTGVTVRAIAALAAAGCALAGGTQVVADGQHWLAAGQESAIAAASAGAGADRTVASDATRRSPSAYAPRSLPPSAGASAAGSAAPSGPASPPAMSPVLATIGHPAAGNLLDGTLPGYPGRVRIWLPQQYPRRAHVLQAVVVLAAPQQLPDVLAGLAAAVSDGRANPLVVVAPDSAPGTAPAPDGSPALDGARLHAAVARTFHVDPSAHGWGVLGLGAGAPCALAAELSHPQWYAAGAGLGGRYEGLGAAPRSSEPTGVRLLLADAQRDTAGQQSAQRLRHALTGVPAADVRLSDTVRDLTDQSERVRLARLSAGYLAEQMATDTRP